MDFKSLNVEMFGQDTLKKERNVFQKQRTKTTPIKWISIEVSKSLTCLFSKIYKTMYTFNTFDTFVILHDF